MRAFLAVLFLMPLPLFADGFFDGRDAQTLQKGLTATADRFILPNHQAQAQAAADLVDSLDAYCAAAGTLEDAQSDYADLFLAWQRASIIQIGPVLDGDGPFRFQLWPDPKGFSRRAIRNATRAQDPAVLAAEGFAEQSVALRNLSALERLVFSDLETDSYACRLALTNARYQQEQAQTLVSAWTPGSEFRVDFDSAADGNARYADVDSVARELLAGSVVYLDRLRKFKILRGLGVSQGDARIERSEARISGLGLASIATSMTALADLYLVEGGFFESAKDIGATSDAYFLASVLQGIARDLTKQGPALDEIYAQDAEVAEALRAHASLLLFHDEYLKVDFPASIGLTAGFTSADGD